MQLDKEIEKMATTQKDFDKLILNVLLMQSRHDQRLQAGFQRMSADMENMKTGLQADMENMKSNVTRLESELRDHRAAMDKEIAVIRERISRNGSR